MFSALRYSLGYAVNYMRRSWLIQLKADLLTYLKKSVDLHNAYIHNFSISSLRFNISRLQFIQCKASWFFCFALRRLFDSFHWASALFTARLELNKQIKYLSKDGFVCYIASLFPGDLKLILSRLFQFRHLQYLKRQRSRMKKLPSWF